MSTTQLIRLDPEHPQQKAIDLAASIIRGGGLVAFPTETVYGLGADAMNEKAILKVFEAKARPPDNPLIVHVASREMLKVVASDVSERAERLIREFWPGPLTLVFKRRPEVARSVTAGLQTVAVRMPRNQIALSLIRAAGTPIAAPSANLSGKPSPTTAAHVLDDLNGRIEMILDGGPTNIGIESTVLDVSDDSTAILRPGWVTLEMLTKVIGPIAKAPSQDELRRSPGTRYRHYSPRCKVVLIERGSPEFIERVCRERMKTGAVGFIGHSHVEINDELFHSLLLADDPRSYASSIYAALREMDERKPLIIVVEGISEEGEGAAVMDRLHRAATELVAEDESGSP